MRVIVRAKVHPTEASERVAAAVQTLFSGDVDAGDSVVLRGTGLDTLRQRIWELRIIDTVRGALLAGARGQSLGFRLSKQAAAAGRVALPIGQAPLGELDVAVDVEEGDPWADAEALAWWLCPETKDGQIVGPTA